MVYYRWIASVYAALCMLLGENAGPVDAKEFWVHAFTLLLGAVIQAYIFGQVALLIADHNSASVIWYAHTPQLLLYATLSLSSYCISS
jgi:hypothetical protein